MEYYTALALTQLHLIQNYEVLSILNFKQQELWWVVTVRRDIALHWHSLTLSLATIMEWEHHLSSAVRMTTIPLDPRYACIADCLTLAAVCWYTPSKLLFTVGAISVAAIRRGNVRVINRLGIQRYVLMNGCVWRYPHIMTDQLIYFLYYTAGHGSFMVSI